MAYYRTTAVSGGSAKEPDVVFLKNASINTSNGGSIIFESLNVEPDWLDTHFILADIKNVSAPFNSYGNADVSANGGKMTYSINSDGHPVASWNRDSHSTTDTNNNKPTWWGLCSADWYAVRKPTES